MSEQEIVYLPLSALRISDQNIRPGEQVKTEDWEEFVASIKTGLKEPLLIEENEVIDGGMRLRALQEISDKYSLADSRRDPLVPCVREPKQEALDQLLTSAITNIHRTTMNQAGWKSVLERLLKMGLNRTDAAKRLGKSKQWATMMMTGKTWSEQKHPARTGTAPEGKETVERFDCEACGAKLIRRTGGIGMLPGQPRYEIADQDNTRKPHDVPRRGKK